MVAGDTRKAEAMAAASKPSVVWSMSGARVAASMAGWAQANMSRSLSSGMASAPSSPSASSAANSRCPAASSACRARRRPSICRLRAAVSSQPSGLSGTPFFGQSASAAAKASDNASSAAATSRVRAARKAMSLP